LITARKCWDDEKIAGQKYHERDYKPFEANEKYREDLEATLISNSIQQFSSLHGSFLINKDINYL